MRLAGLTLERYGPFEHLAVPLDPASGRVNLLVAPNGYGKSVIRQAIGDLLFGIPERTPMDFRFGTERMRLTGEAAQGNERRTLVRRKGRGNTLAESDGAAVAPEVLRQMLGAADETLFRELFGLDTSLLRTGGRELIRSQGRLGQVLFAAGGGMGRVRELLARLERERDAFGQLKARHKSRPLWASFSAWERAGIDLRQAALRPEGWQALERAAEAAEAALAAKLAEQDAATAEANRRKQTIAIRPWLTRLAASRQILATAADAPELAPDFEPQWRAAIAAHTTAQSRAEAAEAELDRQRLKRSNMGYDPAWLDAAEEIEALAEIRGRAQGALTDLPRVQAILADALARSAQLRRDLDLPQGQALPPAPLTRDGLRRLKDYPKLQAAAESAAQARDDAAAALARIQTELAQLPDEPAGAALPDLAAQLRAAGDPAARCEAAQRKLRAAEAALAAALAAIPDRPLPEAALATTAAPSDPALDAADKALTRAESALARLLEQRATWRGESEALTLELTALVRAARLPPPDALAQARAARDTLWQQVCTPGADPAAAVALERAMRAADAVADALIEHSQEVAQAATLRQRIAALAQSLAASDAKLAAAEAEREAARRTLKNLAETAGAADTPDASSLRAFLRARATSVSRAWERDTAARELHDTAAALLAAGARLAQAMGVETPPAEALGALLAEADRRIAASRSLSERRRALTRQSSEQQAALALAQTKAQRAAAQLAAWQDAWKTLALDLARPPEEAPEATAEALPLIETLRDAQAAYDDAARRVADMQAAIALLGEKVRHAARLAPELGALPPVEAALELEKRIGAEQLRAARCRDTDEAIAKAAETLEKSRKAAETARQTLAGLRAALRAEDDEAAERQLRRARDAQTSRLDQAEALRELAIQGEGQPIEVLAECAAATTPEADAARLQILDAGQKARAEAIECARAEHQRTAAARDQAALGIDAADAALRREAAGAAIGRLADEALVLHAAHALLQAALERQAEGADQPLLQRISSVFHDITAGAYAGVAIEDAKAGQTMVALECSGARKPLDHLSEGTSDQLYLALRIAALEDYAASAPALPFVADDVLQTFDDPRTTATLHALLGLSEHVQVIALTHHPHVGELARQLPLGAVHVIEVEG